MQVKLAKHSGFCHGVKFAVDTALDIDATNLYIYGQLIHNESVIAEIEERGIQTVDDLNLVPDGATLILRSHGVGKDIYARCERRNIKVVDCTCSFVKRTQRIAEKYTKEGKTLVIDNKKNHPEVVGICGWCDGGEVYVFENIHEDFSPLKDKDIVIVAQTTYKEHEFEEITKKIIKDYAKTVEIFKTICYTTIRRQKEAAELAKENEAILVIGGQNSSNTQTLYDTCKKYCKAVFKITDVHTFEYNRLKNLKNIAVVSGASTPNAQLQEVLLNMAKNTDSQGENLNMEDIVKQMNATPNFKQGEIVTGIISNATDEGVYILLPNSKKEILLAKEEVLTDSYNKNEFDAKLGEEIEVIVLAVNPLKLSEKAIAQMKKEEALLPEIKNGAEFSAVCTNINKGGLISKIGSYDIFIPRGEIRNGFVSNDALKEYIGKTLRLKAIEIKEDAKIKKEIIASQRIVIADERAQREAEKLKVIEAFFANVHEGDIVEGKVERVTDFGAFVSVNGFDCLAHISDLSWQNVEKVTDILTIGESYKFKVLKIDSENKKVAIGYKQLQPQPWDTVAERYKVGDVVHGKVVRIVPFGLFVEIEKGIDALVHLSEISHVWLENPTTAVAIGEEVDVKILNLEPENKKMTLSIKALLPAPEITKIRQPREKGEYTGKNNMRRSKNNASKNDEGREWKDSSIGGASIAEMLNSKN